MLKDERKFLSLPNVSKSNIKTFHYFCSYLFYNKDILGEKEEEEDRTYKCNVGTDMHLIFDNFWKVLDFEDIFTLRIDPVLELENNPITFHFYGICIELLLPEDRDIAVLQRICWKFACLHTSRFLYLYKLFNGNKFKVYEYFYPREIEQFYVVKNFGIFGTVDTVFKDVDDKLRDVELILDYKTGNIPKDVLRGPRNLNDETSVKVPSKLMFEIHFYGLLFLLRRGWIFDDERVIRFVMNNEYQDDEGDWYSFGFGKTKEEQKEINDKKYKYLTKIKPRLKIFDLKTNKWKNLTQGKLGVGLIFLSGDPEIDFPLVVRKKFNYRTLGTVLHRISEIKSVCLNIEHDEFYLVRKMKTRPEYNEYKCDHCSRKPKCLKEIEDEFKSGLI